MPGQIEKVLGAAIRKILRPIARILLRNGIAYGSFSEIARRVFVEVAYDEFREPKKKQTVSRVSVLTGLTRKEVSRIRDTEPDDDIEAIQRYNRAVRVIGGWINDPRYSDKDGVPKVLSIDSSEPSFASLVKKYSGDIPTKAMLNVLLSAGTVKKDEAGKLSLSNQAYIPSNDPADKLNILGTDVSELITTIDYNITSPETDLRFQRKVSNPNVRPEAMDAFRKMSREKSQSLLEEFDEWLYANEVNQESNKDDDGGYVSVGIYYYSDTKDKGGDT